MHLDRTINFGKARFLLLAAVLGLVISPSLFADPPPADGKLSFDTPNFHTATPLPTKPTPASVFGNYAGAGKCASNSPKPCTDTGILDNVFIQPLNEPETEEDAQIRNFVGQEKTDTHVAIRILRDHGHSYTLEGEMFWSGDHLEFQEEPPHRQKICKLQFWFKNDTLKMKDPGNACGDLVYSAERPATFAGRRFQKGPDQLLAAYKKSVTPPPASLFGTYNGTGKCPTDERKTAFCNENKRSDFIVIKPSETADARVVFEDSSCRMDRDAMWLSNHLVIIEERPDKPGSPYILQFWFKDDTVVGARVNWSHCAAGYFKKAPAPPSHDTKR